MLTSASFKDILLEAERAGTPKGLGRAILREYLQCELLFVLSSLRGSEKLAFIGGTSLRLLHNLERFSEDLDFDNCGLTSGSAEHTLNQLIKRMQTRGYEVAFRAKASGLERGGRLIFNNLLFSLGLSAHRSEKLMIKIEYTAPKPVPPVTTAVLNRFGFIAQVTT